MGDVSARVSETTPYIGGEMATPLEATTYMGWKGEKRSEDGSYAGEKREWISETTGQLQDDRLS